MSERDVIFRETFLRRFADEEERELLQRLGSLALSWAVGTGDHFLEGKDGLTAAELAAVAADLRHLARFLEWAIEDAETGEPHLAHLAHRWLDQVDDLASAIEAAIGETEPEKPPVFARLLDAMRIVVAEGRKLKEHDSEGRVAQAVEYAAEFLASLEAAVEETEGTASVAAKRLSAAQEALRILQTAPEEDAPEDDGLGLAADHLDDAIHRLTQRLADDPESAP